jgi:hypothetical protein
MLAQGTETRRNGLFGPNYVILVRPVKPSFKLFDPFIPLSNDEEFNTFLSPNIRYYNKGLGDCLHIRKPKLPSPRPVSISCLCYILFDWHKNVRLLILPSISTFNHGVVAVFHNNPPMSEIIISLDHGINDHKAPNLTR